MSKIEHEEAVIDLGAASVATQGSRPGVTPDGIQPLQYPAFGLSAD